MSEEQNEGKGELSTEEKRLAVKKFWLKLLLDKMKDEKKKQNPENGKEEKEGGQEAGR